MKQERKPLSSKKPPIPVIDYSTIEEWMNNRLMPGIKPLIEEIDKCIHAEINDLYYAIKWGNAYYGTKQLGWIIELAAYDVSANVVFLKGAEYKNQPPEGSGNESRYIKLRSVEELNESEIVDYLQEAKTVKGWR